jgi:DNA-directed RNA polymerase subunit RPC12/RpoP
VNQPLLQMDLRLVGLAVLVFGAAGGCIWWIGQRLRGELGPPRTSGAVTPPGIPPQVAKELQQRGLASPAQLAKMTEMERHLLFSSMAKTLKQEPEGDTDQRLGGARAFIRPEELPTLFCPSCSYRIERFSSTPPITGKCETCGARVIVRRDGARILLTVLPRDEMDPVRLDSRPEP